VSLRYAEREGVQLESEGTVSQNTAEPVWHQQRLTHAIFGTGEVISEDESSFEVRFGNGDTLNFSKKSAHLYFTPAGD
jgi:DNA helicase-2/ATP-dependent DNA helicase PcrA